MKYHGEVHGKFWWWFVGILAYLIHPIKAPIDYAQIVALSVEAPPRARPGRPKCENCSQCHATGVCPYPSEDER